MGILAGICGGAAALGLFFAGVRFSSGENELAPFWLKWSGVAFLLYVLLSP